MSNARRPKWGLEEAVSAAFSIHEEALKLQTELESRLDAGILDGLLSDTNELRNDGAVALSKRADRKAATMTQAAALALGTATVVAMRTAIRRAFPDDKPLHRELAVGRKVSPHAVGSVVAGLRTVLDAVAANPEKTRAAGILPQDIEDAQRALAALLAADQAQDQHSVSAKEAMARRTATQLRVEAAIGKVLAAAAVAFRKRPDVLARFESLVPSHEHRARRPAKPGASPGACPASDTVTPA